MTGRRDDNDRIHRTEKESGMRHRYTRALLGLAAALFVASAQHASAAATCGDLNGSGARDPGDAVRLNLAINVGVNPADCGNSGSLQCGDLNQDTNLNVQDLVFLVQLLSNQETLLAPCTSFGTVQCGGALSGQITANRVIQGPPACTSVTQVDGTTIVNPNIVLTIQPGARVAGKKVSSDTTPSTLVFLRDSKINAPGTAAQPILFTSDQALAVGGPGADLGDWGGVVLLGRAPVNFPGGVGNAEGLPPGQGLFGGNEPNDSSGVIRFARIEFSGIEFSPDNELNVFTMNGLGRGTTIDHVQANAGFDDCHEWFGGTVRTKFLVSSSCRDDLFDWQIGWTGALQFGLAYQNAGIDNTTGRHAIEADNNEFGFNNEPRSNPNICNLTAIGSVRQAAGGGRSGANLRRGTAGKIYNTLFMDFGAGCLDIDNTETLQQACDAGALKATEPRLRVQNVKCFNTGADQSTGSATGGPAFCPTADDLYDAWGAAGLIDPANNTDPGTDPELGGVPAGSPGGITATYPTVVDDRYFPALGDLGASNCGLEPGFFEAAPYIGAFEPGGSTGGGDNWLVTTGGWINFSVD
jgi:hypothetical protein